MDNRVNPKALWGDQAKPAQTAAAPLAFVSASAKYAKDGMTARIYRPARSAMQSGQAKDDWVLEYEPERPREIDPLMGWTSSSDMKSQVILKFDSKEQAVAYAARNGIAYRVEQPKKATRKVISYSDNFRYNRLAPWSH